MEHLDNATPSMATELHAMRAAFPAVLFGGTHWQRLLERAADLPAAAVNSVFGFEIRLGRPEAASDFCIVIPTDGDVNAHFMRHLSAEDASAGDQACSSRFNAGDGVVHQRVASNCLAACLKAMSRPGSFASTAIAEGGTMLEYDVVQPDPDSRPPPAIFWNLASPLQPSQVTDLARLLAVASGLRLQCSASDAPGAVAPQEPGWTSQLRGVVDVASPYGRIRQVGTFVGRKQNGVRVIVGRVEPREITRLLTAIRWPGPVAAAAHAVSTYAIPGMLLAVAIDVGRDGVGPRLGLEMALPDGWVACRWHPWRSLFDILIENGLCRADKALGLKRWCGVTRLYGHELHFFASGINHVKIDVQEDAIEAKAYLGARRRPAADIDFL